MMAEEEMQRLPRRMQKLSGKSIVVRWDSEETERHRRSKPYWRTAILSGKENRECEAYISHAFSFFTQIMNGGKENENY